MLLLNFSEIKLYMKLIYLNSILIIFFIIIYIFMYIYYIYIINIVIFFKNYIYYYDILLDDCKQLFVRKTGKSNECDELIRLIYG